MDYSKILPQGFKTASYNDGMASRSRHSMFLLYDTKEQFLTIFQGQDIEGFCIVLARDYNKNGKWSSNHYTIAIPEHVLTYFWQQSWELGRYVDSETWQEAFEDFKSKDDEFSQIPFEVFENFVRAELSTAAQRLDATKNKLQNQYQPDLINALKKQQQLKIEIGNQIRKERDEMERIQKEETEKAKAKEIEQKVEVLKSKIKGGIISLDELQQMYENL